MSGQHCFMLLEFETFVREWEATERSRHARLLEEVKHEYRSQRQTIAQELRSNIASTEATKLPMPYTPRLPRAIPHQQVKPQSQAERLSEAH